MTTKNSGGFIRSPPPHFLGVDDAMETSWLYLSRIIFDFSLKPVYPNYIVNKFF